VRKYEELDKYVDWCTKHHVEMEFHYLSGFVPDWFRYKTPQEQVAAFVRHGRQMADRYGDRIKYWQVVNDARLLEISAPVFEEIRRTHPDLKLGVSNCTRFYADAPGYAMTFGDRDISLLQSQGVKLDYYGLHGHTPHGLWADARVMYDTLNKLARFGVKLHITEFFVPPTYIYGNVRRGQWTPEALADFYERYYTICFSHPAVESINYWVLGPDSMEAGTGLLDEKYQPKVTFNVLKELIQHRWRTEATGKLHDGAFSFRGFHGDYEVSVTMPNGRVVKGTISSIAGAPNRYDLKVNEAEGTLK